jgi:5-amino-6-(5-phosphoribosylamino)uracil reductase
MSVDGYIDDASGTRLVLSGEADLDRVDEVRAGCDAIMVGANTIRRDNPRLRIRSAQRRARRAADGQSEHPVRITLTGTGNLDPAAEFFAATGPRPLVFCARPVLALARARLSDRPSPVNPSPVNAEVIDAGDPPSLALLLHKLSVRGISKLLLEGGGQLVTEFLTAGLADELHLVVAPFFVGDPAAPRFALPGHYPNTPAAPMRLAEARLVGDVVLLRYELTPSLATTPSAQSAQENRLPARHGARHAAPASSQASQLPSSAPAPDPPAPDPPTPDPPTPEPPAPEPSASAEPPPGLSLPPELRRRPRGGSRTEDIRWLRETIARLDDPDTPSSPDPSSSPGPQPSSPGPQPSSPGPQPPPSQSGATALPTAHHPSGPPPLPLLSATDRPPAQQPGPDPWPGPMSALPPSFEPDWPQHPPGPHNASPADHAAQARNADQHEHPDPPANTSQSGQPSQTGHPALPGHAGQSGYAGKGGYPAQPGGPGQSGYAGQTGYLGPAGGAGQGGYAGQTGDPAQAGGPGQSGNAGQGGYPSQAGHDAGQSGYARQAGGAGQAAGAGPGGVVAAGGGAPADVDVSWLHEAIELSKRCPPSQTAFSVGAIIVAADGTPLATGFSRETDPRDHAEEAALAKLPPRDPRLAMATLYSSLEPCGVRASRPRPCADLIVAAGLRRVVYAWHEPPLLAPGGGAEKLRAAGVAVIEVPQLADEARRINAHLTNPHPHPHPHPHHP